MQKKIRLTYYLIIVLIVLELLGCSWALSGFRFGKNLDLSEIGIRNLRYFTTDSNVLMGFIALLNAYYLRQVYRGKRESLPLTCRVFFLVGTVGVTLTMLVTVCYLTPTSKHPMSLYMNSNLFLHVLCPLLSIVIFLFFLRTKDIPLRFTLYGMVPMGMYAVAYCINALSHVENGQVAKAYDWYRFLAAGVKSVFIVIPLICLATYLISLGLWALNRR